LWLLSSGVGAAMAMTVTASAARNVIVAATIATAPIAPAVTN